MVRQLTKNVVITLDFLKSERNEADSLTKGLARKLVQDMSRRMGLKPII